jgi:hypothetical protein
MVFNSDKFNSTDVQSLQTAFGARTFLKWHHNNMDQKLWLNTYTCSLNIRELNTTFRTVYVQVFQLIFWNSIQRSSLMSSISRTGFCCFTATALWWCRGNGFCCTVHVIQRAGQNCPVAIHEHVTVNPLSIVNALVLFFNELMINGLVFSIAFTN